MDQLLKSDLHSSDRYKKKCIWNNGEVFIYGSGSFAYDIQNVLEKRNIQVSGFVDHHKREYGSISDIPIYQPDAPQLSVETRKNSVIVIGIHNREADIISIINTLKDLGYYKILSPVDLCDQFAEELGFRYWLTARNYYSAYTSEIQEVFDLLSDDKSRNTFSLLMRFRITGDYSLLPEPDMDHQYIPPDLPAWPQPLRFVDCGAYNGDTLHSFRNANLRFASVAAFEPDQVNFRKLSTYVEKNLNIFPKVFLFPCGVYSSTTQLFFRTGNGEASVAVQDGTARIQCVSLDECIPTFQPTLIKMDIEGAEIDALLGAENTIKENCPALAISAYHKPNHIWEIPLLINKLALKNNLHYTYHYRVHAHNCFDTIFYAIPT